jgi:hypothetical protein
MRCTLGTKMAGWLCNSVKRADLPEMINLTKPLIHAYKRHFPRAKVLSRHHTYQNVKVLCHKQKEAL